MDLRFHKKSGVKGPIVVSIWFTACSIINKCIQIVTVPIFTRLLDTEEYGQYSVFLSWQGIIITIVTLNLYANVFNNGMLKFKDDKYGFLSAMQGLTTVMTLVFTVVFVLFGRITTAVFHLPLWVIILMMVEIMVMPGFEYWAALEKFDYKYRKVVFVTLAVAVLNPVVGLVFVYHASEKGIARIVSVLVVQIIIYTVVFARNFYRGKKFFVRDYWKYALVLALPLVPHYLSQILLNQMDRIMIASMCGNDKAGIYSVAYSAAMVMVIVGKAIQTSFTPWIYKKIESRNIESIKYTVNVLCVVVAIVNFVIICFAPEVIAILGGADYVEAIYIIPPVVAGCYMIFIYSMFCIIEFYYEQTRPMMLVSIAGAIINFASNLIFIHLFDYYAAGYTTLLSYIFFVTVHFLVMKKALTKNGLNGKLYDERFIIIFTICFIMCSNLMVFTYCQPAIRYAVFGIIVLVVIIKRRWLADAAKKLKAENNIS